MNERTDSTCSPPEDHYPQLLEAIRRRYVEIGRELPLFETSATGLYEAFLEALPSAMRQRHTCRSCARFVERYGGLVVVRPDGRQESILWDALGVPDVYVPAVSAMAHQVRAARITGVFLSDEACWGVPVTGFWTHLAIVPAPAHVTPKRGLLGPDQQAAEKREDYGALQRALAEFDDELVDRALLLLTNGALPRSEICLGVARWLADLHAARAKVGSRSARDNLTWLAVATAPPGFCHVRSTMIGTLLSDLREGLPFEKVARRFGEKVSPQIYQRPQAPPSEGNLVQAERLVAALGIAPALPRRFARLDDLEKLWTPRPDPTPPAAFQGVFGHLRKEASKPAVRDADVPPVKMTWEKFARLVLPGATRLEARLGGHAVPFYAFVTACDPNAPPILQWDRIERRNPVSYYTHTHGSFAEQWGLSRNTWQPVSALSFFPFQWGSDGTPSHFGDGIFFVLADACPMDGGAPFLPRFLRSELHEVRATLEAFVKDATLAGREEAGACGLGFRRGRDDWDARVRVTGEDGARVVYHLDRWD